MSDKFTTLLGVLNGDTRATLYGRMHPADAEYLLQMQVEDAVKAAGQKIPVQKEAPWLLDLDAIRRGIKTR